MIEVDGSYGEGGGQILRSSVTLSVLTQKPVRITKIRANRPNPGLRAQHLTAIKFLRELSNANVKGLEIGSSTVEFYPGELVERDYKFDIGTAGSITLVLQTVIPLAFNIRRAIRIKLRGGTDVKWSPTWNYFREVFLPMVNKIGVDINAKLVRRGFYPKGGGEVEVTLNPVNRPSPLQVSEQDYREVKGSIAISKLREDIARRIEHAVVKNFVRKSIPCKISVERDDSSLSEGVSLTLWSEGEESVIGVSSIGERGLPSDKLGRETSEEMFKEMTSKESLDTHMADQILIYLSFVAATEGEESFFLTREITGHTRTNAWLIEKFLPVKFAMERKDKLFKIKVRGT